MDRACGPGPVAEGQGAWPMDLAHEPWPGTRPGTGWVPGSPEFPVDPPQQMWSQWCASWENHRRSDFHVKKSKSYVFSCLETVVTPMLIFGQKYRNHIHVKKLIIMTSFIAPTTVITTISRITAFCEILGNYCHSYVRSLKRIVTSLSILKIVVTNYLLC